MRRSLYAGITVATLTTIFALALLREKQVKANSQEKTTSSIEIKIDNFSFDTAPATIAPGTTVTWINRDDIPHTVVSTEGAFKSKALDTDDKFSYTFSKAGTYPYFCSIHPKMTAKIVVQ